MVDREIFKASVKASVKMENFQSIRKTAAENVSEMYKQQENGRSAGYGT